MLLKCSKESHIDEMLLQKQIHFWEVITVLENKLRVKIDPSKGFTDQEYILVSQLERSLIKGEDEVYSEPYKSFHMKLDEETFIRVKDHYLNKGGKGALVSRELKEEEIAGSKIKYYKVSVLVGFKVDDIDYQKDGENYSCEMYISNIGEKQYKLIVNRTTSERQAKQIEKRILKKYG